MSTAEAEEKEQKREKKTPRNFWKWVVSISIVLFVIEYSWLSNYSITINLFGIQLKWNWGLATFLAQLFYVLISFRTVGPTELGAILFFGKPIRDVGSGLKFVPFLVCQLVKNTRNIIEIELPARPELIFRAKLGEEEVVPKDLLALGYKPPIRVQFGWPGIKLSTKDLDAKINDPKAEKTKKLYDTLNELIANEEIKDDPLNIRMTAETPLVVRLRIRSLSEFLRIFGSIEKAIDQIQDIAVAMLNREFSKITPAVAQHNLGTFSELIKDEIVERIERIESDKKSDRGIDIVTVLLRPFIYSHKLNEALQEPAKERAKKQATITVAEAQKRKDTLEGEGKGAKEKAILDGRTDGFKRMANELGVSGAAVLGAETARAITENPGQKTIVAGSAGFSDLVAVASAVGEVFKKEEKK
ncbi:MAG: SPFH domain-containing protein [Patescibacteria group bacterium]